MKCHIDGFFRVINIDYVRKKTTFVDFQRINMDFEGQFYIVNQSNFFSINMVLTMKNIVFQKRNIFFTFKIRCKHGSLKNYGWMNNLNYRSSKNLFFRHFCMEML